MRAWITLILPAVLCGQTLVVRNARVWTGDPARPWASAIVVKGDRIAAVGNDAAPGARVVDGRGALLTPGFIDSHIHLMSYNRARPLPPIYMRFLRSREEAAERIRGYASRLPKGAWILGDDWEPRLWGGALPTAAWLDELAPEHPVWLVNTDGDAGLANSAALRAAGLSGGSLVGSERMWRMDAAYIALTRTEDERVLEQVMARLAEAGITSVQHNNGWTDFLILRRLREEGRLTVRVYHSPPLKAWRRLRDYIAEFGRGDAWMHWGGLKGYGVIDAANYDRWVKGAAAAGLQVMAHVGDEQGLRTLVGIYERAGREQKLCDPRFRIEHGHDLPADLIPVMAKAGIIASWQPPLVLHYAQRTAAGQPAPTNLFPCRSLIEAGVKIAFGSDSQAPNGLVTPLEGVWIAVERGRMTLDEALGAYTRDAAYAEFAEGEKGSLEVGKRADFVLFDRDFFRGGRAGIREAKVRLTVVGGRVVYEAKER